MNWAKLWNTTATWLFGLSVTILFLALWGRAVVVDTDELANSVAPLAESSQTFDLIADWATEEFLEAGADPALVEPTVTYLLDSTAVGGSLERFINQVVEAAASSHPAGSSIDMKALLTPLIPDLAAGISEIGVPVSIDEVTLIVNDLEPLVIREPGAGAIVGSSSPTASRLGTAVLFASLSIVVLGYSIVVLSEDKFSAFRELLTKVAVSGLTFAVLLRVGSWVLSPSGGRAPIADTLANLADSKWSVPFQVALIAGGLALMIYLVRRRLTPVGVSPEPDVSTRPQEEQPLSLSGLR